MILGKNVKTLVFDIGDSMEPSTKVEIECLKYLKEKHSLPDSFLQVYLEEDRYHEPHMFHAYGEPKIMKNALTRMGLEKEASKLIKEMHKSYESKLKDYYLNDPTGLDFVEAIIKLSKNYKVAILSDNNLEAKELYSNLFEQAGLKFDALIVSEEVGVEKPSRKMFDRVLSELNVKPEEAVYFGNNLKRDSAAEKYGWDFVWVYGFMGDVDINSYKGKKIKFISLESLE